MAKYWTSYLGTQDLSFKTHTLSLLHLKVQPQKYFLEQVSSDQTLNKQTSGLMLTFRQTVLVELLLRRWDKNEPTSQRSRCSRQEREVTFSVTRFGEISRLWQNFKSLWGIQEWPIEYLANFRNNFDIFMLLGKLSLLQMAKDWIVIYQSGHTAHVSRCTQKVGAEIPTVRRGQGLVYNGWPPV